MTREKICGIYKITNLVNGKVYIGQSVDIYRRWVQEKRIGPSSNHHLRNALTKYDLKNFQFDIIEKCTEEELFSRENYWIQFFSSSNPSKGYNKTEGGSHHSKEIREKMSKSRKGRNLSEDHKEKLRKALSGKSRPAFSESWKNNIRFSRLGKTNSESSKLKVSEWSSSCRWYNNGLEETFCPEKPSGFQEGRLNCCWTKKKVMCLETEETFDSASEASLKISGSKKGQSHISQVCHGDRKRALGYQWKYLEV